MAENRTGYFASPHKTASEFTVDNEVLPKGVTGTESDTQKSKCGDGITAWNDLEYNPGNAIVPTSSSTPKFKPLTIGYAGDSIALQWYRNGGLSPTFWFASHLYPADIDNMFNSAVGGTPSSALLDTQLAQYDALVIKPELMIVHSTQNDWIGNTSLADWSYTNVTTYIDHVLANGTDNVIFAGKPPRVGADDPKTVEYLNRKFEGYARGNDRVYFLDVVGLWRLRPTGADVDGVSIEWEPKYSNDGTHPSTEAMLDLGRELIPILSPLVQQKRLQPTSASKYDDTTAPYSNIMGTDGLILGTEGTYNTVLDTRVAGIGDKPWAVVDGDGVIATPSIVVGEDGYNYQQIEFSGTATQDTTITLGTTSGVLVVSEGNFIQEAILYLNDLVGVDSIRYDSAPIVGNKISEYGQEFTGENRIHLTGKDVIAIDPWGTLSFLFSFEINSGDSPTGIVRLGRCGIYRQAEGV